MLKPININIVQKYTMSSGEMPHISIGLLFPLILPETLEISTILPEFKIKTISF